MWVHMHTVPWRPEESAGSSEARITVHWEAASINADKHTLALYESSTVLKNSSRTMFLACFCY